MDNYTIQRSLNGVNWEEVSILTTQIKNPTKIDINEPARYIRLVQNKDENFNISELWCMGFPI